MTKRKPRSVQLSTFGLPGRGIVTRRFKTAEGALREVRRAHQLGFPIIPSGHGTNCAFLEPTVPAIFLKSKDISISATMTEDHVTLTAGAGLAWDDLVRFAVRHGWSGIERLSGIPGTVGAAPVQNIGAYGASLSDVVVSVRCINLITLRQITINSTDCGFNYRTSIFNTTRRGEFLILSVTLRLHAKKIAGVGDHKELAKSLPADPSLSQIRRTILRIRKQKLPDYKTLPNCGSFFKNPIVSKKFGDAFLKKNPDAPHWPQPDGNVKLSAAWLIEQSGARKKHWGKIAVSFQHSLVLVNRGEKKHERLRNAIADIQEAVEHKFKIFLNPEPNLYDKRCTEIAAGIQLN